MNDGHASQSQIFIKGEDIPNCTDLRPNTKNYQDMKQIVLILICLVKLAIGYDYDVKCFNSNFANITSSDDQGSPQVKLNMKHYHKSQMNFGAVQTTLKSASVAVLERGSKAVFEYR